MATAAPAFPNYLQMRQPLPARAWQALRAVSVLLALGLIVLLVVRPRLGLTIWWGFIVPALPLVWLVVPGLWRNLCPMAALNQVPRVFGFTRGITLPPLAT
jgi:nitrite reductase (NADH) large subunit